MWSGKSNLVIALAVLGFAFVASPNEAIACPSDPSGNIEQRRTGADAEAGREPCDDDDDDDNADGGDPSMAPVRNTVECTDELRNDSSAWFHAYDPDWERVDAYQESGLLMSEREEGQVVAILRDCAGNDRGSPFWADPPPEGEGGGFQQLLEARDRALASLELPTPEPQVAPEGRVLNGMPAWLWIEQAWDDLQATDSVPGVTVAVYAEPQQMTWETPEGNRDCDGPGIPWSEPAWDEYQATAASTRGQGNPACTFVFQNASGDQPYATSVTVTWTMGWSINGGARMELDPLELTGDLPVDVGEVRAVRTR